MKATHNQSLGEVSQCVRIAADGTHLLADLQVPEEAPALVLFAHDGRCRNHPRTQRIARAIREMGIGTLLCDLLTDEEASEDEESTIYGNDASFLARRLVAVTKWAVAEPTTRDLRIGYFGANVGGAAACIAAAKMRHTLSAIVSRGGQMDLAAHALHQVTCPTLLIVGEHDTVGIELNRKALPHLTGVKELTVVPGASHLFGEPGTLDAMASLSAAWLGRHLGATDADD